MCWKEEEEEEKEEEEKEEEEEEECEKEVFVLITNDIKGLTDKFVVQ